MRSAKIFAFGLLLIAPIFSSSVVYGTVHSSAEQRKMKLLALIEKQPTDANTQVFIVRGLLDPDFSVRMAAIETLQGITISEVGIVAMVAHLAAHNDSVAVRRSALQALGVMRGPTSSLRSLVLMRALQDRDFESRINARNALDQISQRFCNIILTK